MISPKPEVIKSLATVRRSYPEIVEWLKEWRDHELSKLPSVLQNTALAQGRCQVLSEVTKVIEQSPETISAKSR
jgi:phosphopantothenate synthetase